MERLAKLKSKLDTKTYKKFHHMDHDFTDAGIYDLLAGRNKLLPMAFQEGSPMHPSYGAGHATVAGACTTILKAFFDSDLYFNFGKTPNKGLNNISFSHKKDVGAWQSLPDGSALEFVKSPAMTIEGELNKVAANISIGRDWAGVHYYSDYVQSMIMGEEIAIGMLQEQSITYPFADQLTMTVPKFDGSKVLIKNGEVIPLP